MYAHPYNRRKPVFALYRFARWQLHKRWSKDGKAYRYWGTCYIVCYPDSRESMWLIYNYYKDWDNSISSSVMGSDVLVAAGRAAFHA
jgi:hypothetical protein